MTKEEQDDEKVMRAREWTDNLIAPHPHPFIPFLFFFFFFFFFLCALPWPSALAHRAPRHRELQKL